jgi:hypothetical protein
LQQLTDKLRAVEPGCSFGNEISKHEFPYHVFKARCVGSEYLLSGIGSLQVLRKINDLNGM